MKLYTRMGDAGKTALADGRRVDKCDARVDAYGEIDETNALVGLVRSLLPAGREDLGAALEQIQRDLFALGTHLADPTQKVTPRVDKTRLTDRDIERLEALIDASDSRVPPLRQFILPGGSTPGALLHLARTVCRRAERRMVALDPPVDPVLLRYVNRLSDLLFACARDVNGSAGVPERPW